MTDLFLVLDNEAKFQRNGDIKLFKVLLLTSTPGTIRYTETATC